ncbi:peroxidase TAP [Desarmillaria tabescens]|uniref:Peroxidase TAP n=1 Tax=Armillaria tabescens TaxID=1929756 RepID=A0AA39T7Q2_ARMTA|nr:peroxidase TAP [Desarmillaria tabescens]KAK0470216.1 peroxidase TAP [Desarmillaria tabescens]
MDTLNPSALHLAAQQPLTTPSLDLNNIQGDTLGGLPKKTETCLFFQITKTSLFKAHLKLFIPLIKTTAQVISDRKAIDGLKKVTSPGQTPILLPMVGVNIAFSHFGVDKLGIADADALGDSAFKTGQLKDAAVNLGDKLGHDSLPDWEPAFKEKIDAVILIAGDSHLTVNKKLLEIQTLFGTSIHEVTHIQGDARPGAVSAHEHFGFLDNISNPSVIGFDKDPPPGPKPVRAGALLVGEEGDSRAATRPGWAKDGSFLVFRYLFQLVPEFDDFLKKHPITGHGLSPEDGSELRGARMMGRWKSGAPIDLTPHKDDPELGADPQRSLSHSFDTRNNNFRFQGGRDDQSRCPFAAHVRKTLPRADLEDANPPISLENRRILRRGIQFGPEVTQSEKEEAKTRHERGLLFICYQSSIDDAFQFIQKKWANEVGFPPVGETLPKPGFDPIIGQAGNGGIRTLSGTDFADPNVEINLTDEFVVPRGGEYFFSPSIKSLKKTFTRV